LKELVLRHLKVVSSTGVIEDGYIRIKDGIIVELGHEPVAGFGGEEIIQRGCTAVPGFIDTHTHGIMGLDITFDPEADRLLEMCRHYAKHGVTAFLPTTVSSSHDNIIKVCRGVREAMMKWMPQVGSRILGLHLEGPYLNPDMAGAQNPKYIREPSIRELKEYINVSGNNIRQITIAPEVKGACELIRFAKYMNVTVSAGHTNASYDEGLKSIKLGVSKATHIFNGMTKFHHREPGIALALLQSPSIYLEVIADLIHLHPAVTKMVTDYASPARTVLITDSIVATDMPDGAYQLGELKVIVQQGICKLAETGVLAGSTLTMDKAVMNTIKLGYSLKDAVMMSSITPAESIGLSGLRIGDLQPGYLADIVILSEDYGVVKTIVGGEVVYEK